jgi:hypothetical protein
MSPGFSVAMVDGLAGGGPEEWDELVRATGAPAFYTSTYLQAYQQEPIAPLEAIRYLVARVDGRPVMLAPLYLYRQADPLGRLSRVYPIGQDEPALLSHVWHCYDSRVVADFTAANGHRTGWLTEVVAAIQAEARRLGARWCGFVNVEQATPTHHALTAAGLPAHHIEDRYTAELAGVPDLAGYLARVPPRHRHNLRRHLRRAAEAGVEVAVRPVAAVDLHEVAALCRHTADRFDNRAFYPDGTFERFIGMLGPVAQIIEARQQGRLIGVGICLLDGDRLHAVTGGYDYEVDGNFSPYAVCFAESIELALRLRRGVLEGGRRNERFKLRHGLTVRRLDACLVPA